MITKDEQKSQIARIQRRIHKLNKRVIGSDSLIITPMGRLVQKTTKAAKLQKLEIKRY